MTKEISYYEFVGILVPSVILLFSSQMIWAKHGIEWFDFSKVGESIVFLVICYGIGHLLHSLGNVFEVVVWWIAGGKPTKWINGKQNYWKKLFDAADLEKIKAKIGQEFGNETNKDHGRLIYSKLYDKGKTGRIDIFNGNYSLYRSLCIAFLIIILELLFWQEVAYIIIPIALFLLSFFRMVRFSRYYAQELYRMYLVI